MFSLFQHANGDLHLPSLLMLLGWLAGSAVTGGFMFANLKVNRNERLKASEAAKLAAERIDELEAKQRPRSFGSAQSQFFIAALADFPRRPIRVIVHTTDPETRNFAQQIREALDRAGFEVPGKPTIETIFGITVNMPGTEEIAVTYSDHSEVMSGLALQNAFRLQGIPAAAIIGTGIAKGEIAITVIERNPNAEPQR